MKPLQDKKNSIIFSIVFVILLLSITLVSIICKNIKEEIRISNMSIENRTAMSYGEVKDEDIKTESQNVTFSAFFTRDLDEDGFAERIKGTCKEIGEKDTLYADLNISGEGYLEGGKITLNAKNFSWTTAIVADDKIVDGNYLNETKEIKLKDKVYAGSQKLFWGSIVSDINNNINNYSQVSSMTLTGTYVIENEDGSQTKTEINKEVSFTVDWYGKTKTDVNKYYFSNNYYDSYERQLKDINTLIKDGSATVTFDAVVADFECKLILQKQITEIEIPELNGYSPLDVKVTNLDVDFSYNGETKTLTIIRESEKDDEGNVIKTITRSNISEVEIKYPLEAYTTMNANSVSMNIKIKGYNYGYNNPGENFDEISESYNEGIINVIYSNPQGKIWNAWTYVGELIYTPEGRSTYKVSKDIPTGIYNGNVYEGMQDKYSVQWQVAIADYKKIENIILEEQEEDNVSKSDKFLNSSGQYESMKNYVNTIGIYFDGCSNVLGDDGWINLYNKDTGSLIKTFTKEDWEKYTEDSPYKLNLKSIKIETSNPIQEGILDIFQIKEIDDNLLTTNYTKENFEKLSYILTYLNGKIISNDNVEISEVKKENSAFYEMPYSTQDLKISKDSISNQRTEQISFIIETSKFYNFEKEWKNGIFLLELPEDIISINVIDILCSSPNVRIKNYNIYEENGKRYIKIYTRNNIESVFTIIVNADITANPIQPTKRVNVKLYAYNELCDNYSKKGKDDCDIDNDENIEDYVGYNICELSLVAPSGLLTTEYITNYDSLGSKTIAPNVAEIQKSNNTWNARINVDLTNNYSGTISEVKILGKIPFKENTFTLTGTPLNSNFDANIKGEINIPEDLKDKIKTYYSENESPDKDINNEQNGWKLAENVEDWNKIKTYLIDFEEYKLEIKENRILTYDIEVPQVVECNTTSFSTHAVYFCLDTENGKLESQVEPNKVGIQVVQKYNMQITKNKKTYNNMYIKGATYSMTGEDAEGNKVSNIATTNNSGKLEFNGLYTGKEYVLKEISAPEDYMVEDTEIKFFASVNDNDELIINILDGKFKNTPQITKENDIFIVNAEIEDEAKYSIKINKVDENGVKLSNIKFLLEGESKNLILKTNSEGEIVVKGLDVNEEYSMQEIEADGYYTDTEPHKFKIVRNEEGKLVLESGNDIIIREDEEEIQLEDTKQINAKINEEDGIAQAIVNFIVPNEKIPTYNLQILKVEENSNEEDINLLKPLANATFSIESSDTNKQTEYITNENGIIEIDNLYQYVEGKSIKGEYYIRETKSPDGYVNNGEEIILKVSKNEEGILQAEIDNKENLNTYKNVIIEENTVKLVLQDKPLFKLTKIDSATGMPLANVKFIIFEIDENGKEIDFAKDPNGKYVGQKDEAGDYIVTTNENGEILLPLGAGLYKALEVEYPEGYQERANSEIFEISGKVEKEGEKTNKIIEINYIDDLEDLVPIVNSNSVSIRNSYKDYTIKLMRDLDFNSDDSYKDLNLKMRLKYSAFQSIGYTVGANDGGVWTGNPFSGTFDGQGHKIENINIKGDASDGHESEESTYKNLKYFDFALFGYLENAKIMNLTVTGNINTDYLYGEAGGIAGYIKNSEIVNCHSEVVINGNVEVGGIVGYAKNSKIKDCSNKVAVSGFCIVGGIVGKCEESIIVNCYNTGSVTCHVTYDNSYGYSGGIAGKLEEGGMAGGYFNYIVGCYNTAEIKCDEHFAGFAGGITACYVLYPNRNAYNKISECYNTGNVTATRDAAGIATAGCNVRNSYNTGNITCSSNQEAYAAGIVGFCADVYNCYNTGTVNCSTTYSGSFGKAYAGGIVGYNQYSYLHIQNCYNTGNVKSKCINRSENEYAGAIVGQCYDSSENVTNCYYLNGISVTGTNIGSAGISENSSYMKSLDFANVLDKKHWTIDVNKNNGYPIISVKYIEQINSIEDLVEFSNMIKDGEVYIDKNVYLNRTLDFNENSSYIDSTRTDYDDLNEDGIIEDIKTELTKRSGKGFTPIGIESGYFFSGTFDGKSNEIRNIYINSDYNYSGLFGIIRSGEVRNLGITGEINNTAYAGGIAGAAEKSDVINCYNTAKVTARRTGGILGQSSKSYIENCYNTGKISGKIDDSENYIGGITGYSSGTLNNCYNTGTINGGCNKPSSKVGGITGYGGSITYCYNTGKVSGNACYAGGISGDGSKISCCYNVGIIKCYSKDNNNIYIGGIAGNGNNIDNCYNTAEINGKCDEGECYVGGIVGTGKNITNTYNIGSVISENCSNYVGGIIAKDTNISENNNYYSDKIQIIGNEISDIGVEVQDNQMKSKEFYNTLNDDKVWSYRKNNYPILNNNLQSDIVESTEITIKNALKKLKITTEVEENDGIKGGTITGEGIDDFEIVQYNGNSTKSIEMIPDEGYKILNITINGDNLAFVADENGSYTIPEGYFQNMKEDKHIIVTYAKANQILQINKVDSNDNNIPLENAKFKIEEIDKRIISDNVMGQIQENGKSYNSINKSKPINNVLGGMVRNDSNYYFKYSNSEYTSTNKGKKSSRANSYMKLDLSKKTGKYVVCVTAKISSEINDRGYVIISSSTTEPTDSTYSGRFVNISGTSSEVTNYKEYSSSVLQGGKVYYIHFAYSKNSSVDEGTDTFSVNNIRVYEAITSGASSGQPNKSKPVYSVLGGMSSKTNYYFTYNGSEYQSTNKNNASTQSNSYLKIDLSSKTGKYVACANAKISSEANDRGFATITQDTNVPNYYDSTGRFIYIYGTSNDVINYKEYTSEILEGGQVYYLHFGYYKDSSTNKGDDTFYIKDVAVYEATTDITYGFEEKDGKYISNNTKQANTVANSYIPIDLSSQEGKYDLYVNAEISSEKSKDFGFITIKEDVAAPLYTDTNGRIALLSGEQEAKDYKTILKGGKTYYLQLGYSKNDSIDEGTDCFTINSVRLEPNKDKLINEIKTTDKNGQIKIEVPENAKIKVTEVKAPEGYTINTEPQIIEMLSSSENAINNVLTFENKMQGDLIVHHYLKDKDGNYTNKKVAEDEIIKGDKGASYTTSPHIDLNNLELEKDIQGNYIIPINATGEYGDDTIVVTYYYEVKPIKLTVHHYLEGTENKLLEDETAKADSDINFDEDGNYKILANGRYNITDNKYREELSNDYEISRVITKDGSNLEIGSIFEYKEDTELIYYYKLKEFKITTEVKTHIEKQIDEVSNEQINVEVEGGTITGEYNSIYKEENKVKFVENVGKFKNQKNTIKIVPDEGYFTDEIILISTYENGDRKESIIYGKNEDENAEIKYIINSDSSIELSKLENIQANKHIKVSFTKQSKVIVHHYYIESDGTKTTKKVANDDTLIGALEHRYETIPHNDLNYFKVVSELIPENKEGVYEDNIIEVTYYYELNPVKFTVEHILENTGEKLAEDKTITCNMYVYEDPNGIQRASLYYSYPVKENDDYKEIIQDFEFSKLIFNNQEQQYTDYVYIYDDTIQDENVKLTYYYNFKPKYPLKVKKVDEDDKNKPIENVKFKIEEVFDEAISQRAIKEAVKEGDSIPVLSETNSNLVTGVLGDIVNDHNLYYFTEENGKYTPNNQGINDSIANSYIKLDLSEKTGRYVVDINAEITGEQWDNYGYAIITENEIEPDYWGNDFFVSINGNVEAKDYISNILDGGKVYYLHLRYRKYSSQTNTNDSFTINSIAVYDNPEETILGFEKVDDKYISTMAEKNDIWCSSRIPIDLTNIKGEYKIKVNAEMVGEGYYNQGIALINEENKMPDYNNQYDKWFISMYQATEATDYVSNVLEGGKMYYLHLAFHRYESLGSENIFKVNNIEIIPGFTETEAITDSNGNLNIELVPGRYKLTELETTNKYILDSEPKYVDVGFEIKDETIITNAKRPYITVHHYYVKNDGTKTTNKVAEDDIHIGDIGEEYVTVPHDDLVKFKLDESLIPENASGIYNQKTEEVIYYYKLEPINLTIHHYFESTGEKLAADKTITMESCVKLYENGIYRPSLSENYVLKNNSDYNNITKDYDLSKIVGSDGNRFSVEDILDLHRDYEVSYYYKLKKSYPLKIKKVDEDDDTKTIQNVKFKIEGKQDPRIGEGVSEGTKNTSLSQNSSKQDGVLGEFTNNGSYYFIEDNGKYKSNNKGVSNSNAYSYVKIDLSNKTGKFAACVNAEISCKQWYNYGYAKITESTEVPQDFYNDGFINITGEQEAKDYCSNALEGGKVYYLHFNYSRYGNNNDGSDTFTINSINVYNNPIETRAGFDKIDDKYVLNTENIENDIWPAIVIPIDLTNTEEDSTVKVNAEIVTNAYKIDNVTFLINEKPEISNYDIDYNEVFATLYGTIEAQDYTSKVLQGGKMYYLHIFSYLRIFQGGANDIATINSIKIEPEMITEKEIITNSNGRISEELAPGTYKITEIEAPEEYIVNSEPIYVEVGPNNKDEVVITNKKHHCLIVHHYLKDSKGNYTEQKIADDDVHIILPEEIGSQYLTSRVTVPTEELPYLIDEKDINGNSIIPLNATGVYGEENIEVTYYYTYNKYKYNVEYYFDGVKNDELTEEHEAYYNDIITDYTDNSGNRYILQEVSPAGENGKANLKITEDEEENLIVIKYISEANYKVEHYIQKNEGDGYDLADTENKTGTIGQEATFETKTYQGFAYNANKTTPDDKIIKSDGTLVIKLYYDKIVNAPYKVEHYQQNLDMQSYTKVNTEDFTGKIGEEATYSPKNYAGFIYAESKTEPENKVIKEDGTLVIKLYYDRDPSIVYSVQYYYDGVIDIEKTENSSALFGSKIDTYTDKAFDNYVLDRVENLPLTIGANAQDNIIKVYYISEFKVITEVVKHAEVTRTLAETTTSQIEGGTISKNYKVDVQGNVTDEEESFYEKVLRGKTSNKEILIKPSIGYEVVSVKINDVEKLPVLKEANKLAQDGSITLKPSDGYFVDMQEDKVVKVEFRKKTKVTVKYLDKLTNNSLAPDTVIDGVEGKGYETSRASVENYKASQVLAQDAQGTEANVEISGEISSGTIKQTVAEIKEDANGKKYAKGTMYANELTIIYWYEKIPSGVWVRHVEIDEVGKLSGEKTEIKSVEKLTFIEDTKQITRDTFDGYVKVNCPSNMNITGIENIVAGKDDDTITVTYSPESIVEVWFFYEKEHKIITKIVPHKEMINGVQIDIAGGTISTEYKIDEHGNATNEPLEYYEKVLHRGNSAKKIEIKPQDGYRIKDIKINDKTQNLEALVKIDGTASFDAGAIEDIKDDILVKVEFERIPAKVIVKYIDIETNEEIVNQKQVNGYVNDSYNEPRVEIEGYEAAGGNPTNAIGNMNEETITIIYYYVKHYAITTEVRPHNEIRNGEIIQSKGGSISGEGLTPYEFVIKGNSSIKQIVLTPEYGYIIRKVIINDIEQEFIANEDEVYELPLFENLQENKHIIVEYERIPAKVKVQYLEILKEKDSQTGEEIDVEKEIAESDLINGYVNDEYKTKAKDIDFYQLVEAKLPENEDGVMAKDEIIVKYYYKKSTFNMKVEKEIIRIMLNGEEQEIKDNSNAEVEISYNNINEVDLEVSYRIKVTNTESLAGSIVLEEIIPNGFELVLNKNGKMWTKQENQFNDIAKILDGGVQYALETEEIKPGETTEYIVRIKWIPSVRNKGTKINVAQIGETKNAANYEETTLSDNISEAKLEIELNKIDAPENTFNEDENITTKDKNVPQTGQTRVIYIVLGMIVLMSIVGITAVTFKIRKNGKGI